LALSAGLVIATVTAAFTVRHHYARTLMEQVWPVKPMTAGISGEKLPERNILLLGDSRIADWNGSFGARRAFNCGFRGITTAELAMIAPEILQRKRPEIVVIQVGINDLKLLGVRPDQKENVITECVSNILTIVSQSEQSGARVIFTPIWPVGHVDWQRRFVWSDAVAPAITETNLRLQHALETDTNVVVEDIFFQMVQHRTEAQRLECYADTLHLTPQAYGALSELLAKKLEVLDAGSR
jgi:lysophospholipase L1-like esterase